MGTVKNVCGSCGGEDIRPSLKQILCVNGQIDEEYIEESYRCKNMVYGCIKTVELKEE